jgi:hypothetical protein
LGRATAGGGTRTLTGLSPHRIFLLRWLSPPSRFVAWTFSWPWMSALGLSRKVSTPSSSCLFDRRGGQDIRACKKKLGSGLPPPPGAEVPPNSTESTRGVSCPGAQIGLSPMRLPIPPLQLAKEDARAHDPDGIRTRVAALKGPCPRPLDDGAGCPAGSKAAS